MGVSKTELKNLSKACAQGDRKKVAKAAAELLAACCDDEKDDKKVKATAGLTECCEDCLEACQNFEAKEKKSDKVGAVAIPPQLVDLLLGQVMPLVINWLVSRLKAQPT